MNAKVSVRVKASRAKLILGALHRSRLKLFSYWSQHPGVDLVLAVTPVVAHGIFVWHFGGGNLLAWASGSQRTDTYAAGAAVSALVAGFTGTAIAQYGSSSGPLITWLRAVHGSKIRKNWLSITKWLMVAAVLCVFSMAMDGGDSSPKGSNWIFETAFLIAIAKFARLVYLFDLIMTSVDKQDEGSFGAEQSRRKHERALSARVAKPTESRVQFDEED